jgi:hypothetical protein
MTEHDPGAETPEVGGVYSAMGFTSPEGDLVLASLCPLPVGFAERVAGDPDGLGREVAGRVLAVGGELVESGQITVDGRPAFYRIVGLPVRLAGGEVPNGVYAVGLVVPLEDPPA